MRQRNNETQFLLACAVFARGLSVREIQGHLEEMYGTELSPTRISSVTDAASEDVELWQARPLDAVCPILYLDCIHGKVRADVDIAAPRPSSEREVARRCPLN